MNENNKTIIDSPTSLMVFEWVPSGLKIRRASHGVDVLILLSGKEIVVLKQVLKKKYDRAHV